MSKSDEPKYKHGWVVNFTVTTVDNGFICFAFAIRLPPPDDISIPEHIVLYLDPENSAFMKYVSLIVDSHDHGRFIDVYLDHHYPDTASRVAQVCVSSK